MSGCETVIPASESLDRCDAPASPSTAVRPERRSHRSELSGLGITASLPRSGCTRDTVGEFGRPSGPPVREWSMSLRPEPIGEISAETARVARAAFPKGTVVTRLRDEFSALYEDEDFRQLYPARGQPGLAPWRLALVTVFQFLEPLSARRAAAAGRARIDWKYALGLELTAPGFHFSVLAEFRARL